MTAPDQKVTVTVENLDTGQTRRLVFHRTQNLVFNTDFVYDEPVMPGIVTVKAINAGFTFTALKAEADQEIYAIHLDDPREAET